MLIIYYFTGLPYLKDVAINNGIFIAYIASIPRKKTVFLQPRSIFPSYKTDKKLKSGSYENALRSFYCRSAQWKPGHALTSLRIYSYYT